MKTTLSGLLLYFVTCGNASHATVSTSVELSCKVYEVKTRKTKVDVLVSMEKGQTKELFRDAVKVYSVTYRESYRSPQYGEFKIAALDLASNSNQSVVVYFESFPPQIDLITQSPWEVTSCWIR